MTARVVVAYGTPKPKGSLRHVGHGRLIEQVAGSAAWRDTVAIAAAQSRDQYGWETWTGVPVVVRMKFVMPRPKTVRRPFPTTRSSGDVDKLCRNVLDALVDARIIGDDSQVVDMRATKTYEDGERARAGVRITLGILGETEGAR